MIDPRYERLAQVVVEYSLAVRPGDRVVLNGSTATAPLMVPLFEQVVRAGGHPLALPQPPELVEILLRRGSDEQIRYLHEPQRLVAETYEAGVTLLGSDNTKALSNVSPAKLAARQAGRRDLLKTGMERMGKGEYRWCGVQCPTASSAQDAEMSLTEYEDFVFGACLPDPNDPVGHWRRVSERQARLIGWLGGRKTVRVTGPETDLTFRIDGRPFLNCDGRLNMPDGEVCTSPIEDSMEGGVWFPWPSVYAGREVSGIRLRFQKGQVVEASAEKGESFLLETIKVDAGARRVGEFAIGTNEGITRPTRETLFDEKIAGSFHMALGAGLHECGGTNDSAVHWDLVCDLREGGEIRVDGEVLHKDGRFVLWP